MDLQIYLEVDGSDTKQGEFLREFATDKGFNSRFEVEPNIGVIRLWADELPEDGQIYDLEPNPEEYAQVIREIVDTQTFAHSLKAKLITTDPNMENRCNDLITERGLEKWTTAGTVNALFSVKQQYALASGQPTAPERSVAEGVSRSG